MGKLKEFLKRKDVVFSAHRYGIDAMGAMAQGLFASLLIGTIIKTLGEQIGLQFLVDAGTFAQSVAGPAMAASIGYALHTPPLVLFSLIAVGSAANSLGGAGGPLAVYFIAIVSAECGKLVSKETKVDIIVTPAVTILVGTGLSVLFAPAIGAAASAVGSVIMWATELQPLLMGILVSVLVGIALTLPISSAAICAALNLTGLAGGAAVAGCCAQMVCKKLPQPEEQASFRKILLMAPSSILKHFISWPPISMMKSTWGIKCLAAVKWATVSTRPRSQWNAFLTSSSP